MSLNPEQRAAVEYIKGRVLILAGAGSGKTRVLTERMAYLISAHGVSPQYILGLTFTNKAAEEMRQRIAKLVPAKAAGELTLCTFHSFCMKILREEIHHLGFTKDFSLYDEKDVERLVKLIARDILDHEAELPSLGATLQIISQANNKGFYPPDGEKPPDWHGTFAKEVFGRLQDSFRAYNAVDFDHLLTLTVELFEKHPEVLERYQEQFRFIMIDEYQDTNPIQFRLAELLAKKYQNLCVVGDDDQAIYGWRGAEVKNILTFDKAKTIKLEQNYRSTNTILKAANALISRNTERFPKILWSQNGEGRPIEVFVAPSENEEAEAVAARISILKKNYSIPFNEMAILYRSNTLARAFEIALMKQPWQFHDKWVTGIPYEVYGGLEFYERKEVKDLLAYLRVILNPLDQEAILRVINQPRRGIGEKALDFLTGYGRKNDITLWSLLQRAAKGEFSQDIPAKARQGVVDFVTILEEAKKRFAESKPSEVLDWFLEKVNFEQSIEEDVKSDKMRDFKRENIQEFRNALASYEEGDQASLRQFVSNMTLNTNMGKNASTPQSEKVNLMTFHSAKGLEFEACFLIGIEDQIIPHEKSLKENGMQEERRLMYVAITRAKKYLTLSMAKQRQQRGVSSPRRPSPFLQEIPKELLKPKSWHDVQI